MDYFTEMQEQYGKPGYTKYQNMLLEHPHLIMQKSKYLWIIDAGHGGSYNGKYTTKPYKVKEEDLPVWARPEAWETKSFIFPPSPSGEGTGVRQICEGTINRTIATALWKALQTANIDFALVYDEVEDTPLAQRVTMADNLYRKYKNCIYLSIHSDKLSLAKKPNPLSTADFHIGGKASACSIYTSKGQTKSDKVANIFFEIGQKTLPNMKWRTDHTDGDADMEADFYVLRKTDCPAILCETGFYDNERDANWLTSAAGQEQYKQYLLQSILATEKLKPI